MHGGVPQCPHEGFIELSDERKDERTAVRSLAVEIEAAFAREGSPLTPAISTEIHRTINDRRALSEIEKDEAVERAARLMIRHHGDQALAAATDITKRMPNGLAPLVVERIAQITKGNR